MERIENFGYENKKEFACISLKFDLKNPIEEKIYHKLSSMDLSRRTLKIISLFSKKHVDIKNEFTIYEQKLFDLLELSLKNKNEIKVVENINKNHNFKQENFLKNNLEKNDIILNSDDFDIEIKKEKKDYEKLINEATENGFN